ILLLACANMASLLLARAAGREQEMATRRALGAHRRQVASQLLIESLMLAAAGGVAGVAFAVGLHRILLALASGLLPRLHDVRLDLPVLGFACAISLATGLIFGLAPVLYTWSRNLAGAMRGGRGSRRPGLARARTGLVVAQVALAVVLALGAALTVKSLLALRAVDPGFDIAGIGVGRIYLDSDAYAEDAEQALYFEQLSERLQTRPEIEAAGASSGLPMDPLTIDYDLPYTLPGEDATEEDASRQAYFRTITPGYLEAVGIPLRRGRAFHDADRAESEPVALVNETFARLGWPDRDPVGESFTIWGGSRTLRIVGVVGNVRFSGPADAERAEFYVPHSQVTYGSMAVVARAFDGHAAATAIAEEALGLDPRQPVHSTATLEGLARGAVATPRFVTLLLVAFASVALALAAAGIYGVLSGWVAESRRELGVRIAIGADGPSIAGLVLRRSLATAGVGLVLGLATVQIASGPLLPFLFGVGPRDLTALGTVVSLLVAIATLASLAPALRAARLEPMDVLRLD
ncbi:MAG: FtsX-like permease family protein, partial [Holophagales bacterium]|nr:FtsX-like permease family protein [Holophagales bacterium]